MNAWLRRFVGSRLSNHQTSIVRDERGLSTVEYVIILILIAASAIGIWSTFGKTVKEKIDDANKEVQQEVNIDGKGSQ